MTNTTKNTTKSIFLALSVAFTMGVASAAAVPGLPSFSNGGVDTNMFEANGAWFDPTGAGSNAITNINNILESVGDTSGSNINNTKFWQSFVDDEKTQTFDFNAASPFISELVYTVLGQGEVGSGNWVETDLTSFTSNIERTYSQSELEQQAGFKVNDIKTAATLGSDGAVITPAELYTLNDVETQTGLSTTVASNGNYVDGNIKVTGENAIKLLSALNFNDASGNAVSFANFGAVNCTNVAGDATGCSTTTSNTDANVLNTRVELVNDMSTAVSTTTTSVSTTVLAAGFLDKVSDAELNETAFINANLLISKIADQLKNGYILDVAAATNAITQVIGQHNAFLGASIVDAAHGIKDSIKVMGLQVAAAEVGKVARGSCVGIGQSIKGEACVAIGSKFSDILNDIGNIDSAATATSYNEALAAIDGFANDLIEFNGVATGYSASTANELINTQFGTITVAPEGDFYNSLVAADNAGTGNPVTGGDWSNDANFIIEDFDSSININGDDLDLF